MEPEILKNDFNSRKELIDYVYNLMPDMQKHNCMSFTGGSAELRKLLKGLELEKYSATRNYFDGYVTKLSPFITHGLLSTDEIKRLITSINSSKSREKFVQQLAWREFWKLLSEKHPQWLWRDVEPYKTGYKPEDYNNKLPNDITSGKTGVKVIDSLCETLTTTGYLHNHGRMYLSSYIVHWRKVKWQAGAEWFLQNLIDANEASNNFSWQWIASTFSNKPYIFNLENVRKYSDNLVICDPLQNKDLNYSYSELNKILFPRILNNE